MCYHVFTVRQKSGAYGTMKQINIVMKFERSAESIYGMEDRKKGAKYNITA
jgi:hypothetical protein